MADRQDLNVFVKNSVDYAMALHDELASVFPPELRDYPPGQRKLLEALYGSKYPGSEQFSGCGSISSNE